MFGISGVMSFNSTRDDRESDSLELYTIPIIVLIDAEVHYSQKISGYHGIHVGINALIF